MTKQSNQRLLYHLPHIRIREANLLFYGIENSSAYSSPRSGSREVNSEGIYFWATSFIEKLILPILSLPRHTTVTLSPSVSTSST